MVDDGNVLPQAEIDALFKQATGRNMEVSKAPMKENPSAVLPVAQPKKPVKTKTKTSEDNVSRSSTLLEAGSGKIPDNEKIDELMNELGKLTRRIENLEDEISNLRQSRPDATDKSDLERRLLKKIKNEENNLHKVSKNVSNILARLKETPGYGVRGIYTCNSCGSRGFMAIAVKCSICGTQGWLGWWPE